MLKIATIFSGIGAIEQAALRLGVEHEVIFACDIGGVNLYKKSRPLYIDEVDVYIYELEKKLNKIYNENSDDLEFFNKMNIAIMEVKDEISLEINKINNLNIDYDYNGILKYFKIIKAKKFKENMNIESNIQILDLLIKIKKYLTNIVLKKIDSNYLYNLSKKLKEDQNIINTILFFKEITGKLERINEMITTQIHLKDINNLESFKEKKEYVKDIYREYENKNFVKKSYLANYKLKEEDFHWNVSYLDGNEYKHKVDLFVGGSPCQSFSIAGKRKGMEDTRGTLFYEFIRLVKEIEPRVFIYENVKGLLNHDGGKTWKIVKECFNELGYYYTDKVFNSKNFGIPQNRERVFVIGFKNKEEYLKFSMIEKKDLNYLMKSFLLDENKLFLPKDDVEFIEYDKKENYPELSHICFDNWMDPLLLLEKQKLFVTNEEKQRKKYTQINGDIMLTQRACQQYNLHGDFIEYNIHKYFLSDKVKEYVLDTTTTFNSKNIENHINCDIAKAIVASSAKMHRAIIDNYIGYGNDIPINKRKIRRLHPRECFRLMGFSDTFKIIVSDTQAYHQAGNSIVVDVLVEILKGIRKSIDK